MNLNLLARCVSCRISFAATHSAMPPFIFALIVRVHPAALTVRVHEVLQPVRVHLQGCCWVRNGIKVDWLCGKYMTICLTSVRCYKRGFNARVGKLKLEKSVTTCRKWHAIRVCKSAEIPFFICEVCFLAPLFVFSVTNTRTHRYQFPKLDKC